jgi:hypothetical protein
VSELARKVALGFAVSVIVGVLGALFKQPLVDAIVEAVSGVPGFLVPVGEWIEAHRVVFALVSTVAGGVLALSFAKLIGVWDGAGMIVIGGGLLGYFAGQAVLGWLRGSVTEGPVTLALITVIAVFWAVASARGAARMKRLWASEARARARMTDDRSLCRLPPVRIEPPGLRSRDIAADRRAAAQASFLSPRPRADAHPVQRRASPPTG